MLVIDMCKRGQWRLTIKGGGRSGAGKMDVKNEEWNGKKQEQREKEKAQWSGENEKST